MVPDLRGLFIRGAKSPSEMKNTQGSDDVELHPRTAAHDHSFTTNYADGNPVTLRDLSGLEDGQSVTSGNNAGQSGHAHSGRTNVVLPQSAGPARTHDNRPKHMALMYIVRIR